MYRLVSVARSSSAFAKSLDTKQTHCSLTSVQTASDVPLVNVRLYALQHRGEAAFTFVILLLLLNNMFLPI